MPVLFFPHKKSALDLKTRMKMSKNRVAASRNGQYNLQKQKEIDMDQTFEPSQHYKLIEQAMHQVGLSSLGRLHDLFVTTEAVTPGEYKSGGAGLTIQYGIHPTPFGKCLIATTERGICNLSFVEAGEGMAIDELVA